VGVRREFHRARPVRRESGLLEESSLACVFHRLGRLATIQPIYGDDASPSSNEFDAEYDEEYDDGWQREPMQRRHWAKL